MAAPTATGQQAFLDACEEWDEWEKPAPPFRLYGNSYYVGTCGIASVLIAGKDGHILIDGGSRNGGPLVEQSIEKLGYRIEDVEILLYSHEHFDHVAGLAYLQEKSGARVISSNAARKALETGQSQPGDPQHGMHDPFAPVVVSQTVTSFEPVSHGMLTLMPLETPGHTPGAMSWQWWSCEGTDCRTLVYADSLSPIGRDDYKFSENPEYVSAYRAGLEALAELPCDMLITPHPSASWMFDRMASEDGLFGERNCKDYAASISTRLDRRLADEVEEE